VFVTGCCQQRLVLVVARSNAARRDLRSAVFPAGAALVIVTAVIGAVVTSVVFMPVTDHDCGFVSIKYFKQSFNRLDINILRREIIPTTTD